MTTYEAPDYIKLLDALLIEQLTLEAKLSAEVKAIEERIAAITGNAYERTGIKISGPWATGIIEQYAERVEAVAVRRFSVPGGPFVVDTRARPEINAPRIHELEDDHAALLKVLQPVMPSAYWRILEAQVDPEAQKRARAREVAITLGKLVGLLEPWSRDDALRRAIPFKAPKQTKGCFEFEMPGVHVRESWKSREHAVSAPAFDVASALGVALHAADYAGEDIGHELRVALRTLDRSSFESRYRIDLGDGAHLITYLSGTKLFLPVAVGEIINLFISEHLAEAFADQGEAA